jgi:hypothetical protein
MAFFCAVDPLALMVPVEQSIVESELAVSELPPHALSVSASTAIRAAPTTLLREVLTFI